MGLTFQLRQDSVSSKEADQSSEGTELNPNDPCFRWSLDLVLWGLPGLPSKIEVIWVLGLFNGMIEEKEKDTELIFDLG